MRLSLKYRIAVIIFALEAIMMGAVLWQTLGHSEETTRNQLAANEQALLGVMSGISRIALLTEEYAELQPYLENVLADPRIEQVLLVDVKGRVVAGTQPGTVGRAPPSFTNHSGQHKDHSGNHFWRSTEITNAEGLLGILAIELTNTALHEATTETRNLGISIAIIGMTVIAFVGLIVGVLLTRRLALVTETANRFAQGELTARTKIHGQDEIGELGQTFDKMAVSIQKSQQQIQDSQQRLLLHRKQSPLGVIEWNTDFEFVDWNPAAQRIFGFTKEEVLGKHVFERILPESARPAVDGIWNDLLTNRGGTRSTNENITKDGRTILCDWYNTPLVDQDGKVIGVASLVDDITERKQTEVELEKHRHHLQELVAERTTALEAANKELEAFSYSVSHDLRAPLRGIDGFSQILLEDHSEQLDEEGKGYLQRVRDGVQRMSMLIDDMLMLSRTTQVPLKRQPVDISKLANNTVIELREGMPDREVEIQIVEGLQANADPKLMAVALDNLLGNAWKYTGKQERAAIEFGMSEQDDEPVFYVKDNGVGFDMRHANKLFSAFQRLHKAGDFSGTGVGLATVQRIIQRHGGRIWAEAELGKGAIFYFTLPARKENKVEEGINANKT